MKQFSARLFYSIFQLLLIFNFFVANSQGIKVYPNPGVVPGYAGNLITFRNEVYFSYKTKADAYGPTGLIPGPSHLAKLSGDTIQIIANPDSMPGYPGQLWGYPYPIVYNNNLYFQYQTRVGTYSYPVSTPSIYKLAKFDGNKITLINNPDSGSGYASNGVPIVWNGSLYFQYINAAGNWQVAKYNDSDTTISLIPNINTTDQGAYPFEPVIFNGNLYFNYWGSNSSGICKYDGNSNTLIPDSNKYSIVSIDYPKIIYKNNLYLPSVNNDSGRYYLTKFDGSKLSIIPTKGKYGEYSNNAIVYNDTLFFSDGYYNSSKSYTLSRFDGTNITQVNYPGNDTGSSAAYQFYNYNNQLYLVYSNKLARLVGNSIDTIPFPVLDSLNVSLYGGTVLNNDLYFCYTRNNTAKTETYTQLLKYDGNKTTAILRPDNGSVIVTQGSLSHNILSLNGTIYFGYTDTLNNSHLASYTPQSNVQLTGSIATPNGNKVKNVDIINTSTDSVIANTSITGGYTDSVQSGNNYAIKAYKNNDINKVNGVTSLDLALIQSHILQKNLLNSPYKIIAADVNGDGKVTALDLVYMKRLILGLDTTFTNTSTKEQRLWAFVDSSYKFPDTTNPFPFKDSISYTGLNANQTNQTFIGIKLGDVNWDWNPAIARMPSPVFVRPKKLMISQ